MRTEEMIKVMQAYVDGKTIECRDQKLNMEWRVFHAPIWNWHEQEYRVKPEPREFWMNVYSDGSYGEVCALKEIAVDACTAHGTTIKVREVLEDETN